MTSATPCRLALLVRSGAFDHRTARSEVDLALAASALDFKLEIFHSYCVTKTFGYLMECDCGHNLHS